MKSLLQPFWKLSIPIDIGEKLSEASVREQLLPRGRKCHRVVNLIIFVELCNGVKANVVLREKKSSLGLQRL